MPFAELLRATVFLCAGGATALGVITVLGAGDAANPTLLLVGAGWWIVAGWIGLSLGASERSAEGMRKVLAGARSIPAQTHGVSLPSPTRVAWVRLWPILAAVGLTGVLGIFFPEVSMIGSGYALLVALAWRNREQAVLAIEVRDGVRFLVESGSTFSPITLIRSPGFHAF